MKSGQTALQTHRRSDQKEPKTVVTDDPAPAPEGGQASKEAKSPMIRGCQSAHTITVHPAKVTHKHAGHEQAD